MHARLGSSVRVACAGVVALAAAPVAAQAGPEDGPPADELVSDWQIGPFYAKPTLEVSDLGYDSNPFNRADGASDVTAQVAPGIRLALPMGDHVLSIHQKLGYSFYQDESDRNTWGMQTDIGLELLAGGLRLDLEESLRRTNGVLSVERLARPLRVSNTFTANAVSDRQAGGYIEAEFRHRVVRFDQEEVLDDRSTAEDFDSTVIDGRLELFLDLFDPARLVLGGDAIRHDFRFGSPDRDARGYFVYSGFRMEPQRGWRGTVRVGYRRFEVGDQVADDHAGVGVDGNLAIDLSDGATLRLRGRRNSRFTDVSADNFGVATRLGGDLLLSLGGRNGVELTYAWSDVRYPLDLEDSNRFDGKYEFRSFGGSLLFAVSDEVMVEFGAAYRDLASDDRLDYDGVSLTTGFRYGIGG